MPQKIYFFLIIVLFFTACHNDTENDTTVAVNKEQQLKDSVEKYPDSMLLRENLIEYYRENKNYAQALATTNDYLKKDSLNPRLWDIQGTLYFETKDTLHSIRSFENAVALLPTPPYLMSLGSLYAETKDPRALTVADALMLH
jgi:predicted Zn-dependent protease